MNKDGNTLVTALIAVILALLMAVAVLYMMREGEKDKKTALQRQVDGLLAQQQNLEGRIKEMEIAEAQNSANMKFQEEKINMLTRQIEEEKASNDRMLARMQEKDIEIHNLRVKLEGAKAEKEEAVKKGERLNEDYLQMKFQLENLMKTKEELEKRAKDIAEKEGVGLGTVVIKQSGK
jgi:chromosome segregation ATPase